MSPSLESFCDYLVDVYKSTAYKTWGHFTDANVNEFYKLYVVPFCLKSGIEPPTKMRTLVEEINAKSTSDEDE